MPYGLSPNQLVNKIKVGIGALVDDAPLPSLQVVVGVSSLIFSCIGDSNMSFLCKNFLLGDAAQGQGSMQEVLCSIPSTMRKQDVAFRKYLMAEVTYQKL